MEDKGQVPSGHLDLDNKVGLLTVGWFLARMFKITFATWVIGIKCGRECTVQEAGVVAQARDDGGLGRSVDRGDRE